MKIVQIAIQSKRYDEWLYNASRASWEAYAKKYDLGYQLINDASYEPLKRKYSDAIKPQWVKAFIPELFPNEDRILYVDSDTIISPTAPNIFKEYPDESKIYAVSNRGSMDWVVRSCELYAHILNKPVISPTSYFNSGVILFSKEHSQLFKSLADFYLKNKDALDGIETKWCLGTDQPVMNYWFKDVIELIPYRWNMQDLIRHEIDSDIAWRCGYVAHFNAGDKNYLASIAKSLYIPS